MQRFHRWLLTLGLALLLPLGASPLADAQTSPPAYPMADPNGPPPGQIYDGAAPDGYGADAPAQPLSQDQLDALLAPIALYPDQLLTQVLMASTYPAEVAEAAQFVQQNPSLTGDALDQALQQKSWDPSVLSLAAFPQVLVMMNDQLDWTQQLGDVFLADQQRVMDTVQSLRAKAQQAGNLQSNDEQRVSFQDQSIVIEPAQPDYLYVPVYNPLIIYGPWWAPSYRPWYWFPPAIYGYRPVYGGGIVWGRRWGIRGNHWGWSQPNWRGHSITINVGHNAFLSRYGDRYRGGTWQHIPDHRRGVAYRDNNVRNQYQRYDQSSIDRRRDYRGNDLRAQPQSPTQSGRPGSRPTSGFQPGGQPTFKPGGQPGPQPTLRPAPGNPAVSPQGQFRDTRPQVQIESNRGQMSRDVANRAVQGTPMMRSAPSAGAAQAAGNSNNHGGGRGAGGDGGGRGGGGGGGGRDQGRGR